MEAEPSEMVRLVAWLDAAAGRAPGTATLNEIRVLLTVALRSVWGRPVGISTLAESTGVPRATVSRITADAVWHGLLVGERCDVDRRCYRYELSAEGVRALRDLAAKAAERAAALEDTP